MHCNMHKCEDWSIYGLHFIGLSSKPHISPHSLLYNDLLQQKEWTISTTQTSQKGNENFIQHEFWFL